MTAKQSSGSNGKVATPSADQQELRSLLREYLDGIEAEGFDDPEASTEHQTTGSAEQEGQPRLKYRGEYRTTTGVVRIMRESGNIESAELMEELRQTQESAKQLLDQLRSLYKRKTGTYPRPSKDKQVNS